MVDISKIQGLNLSVFCSRDFYCMWPQTGHRLLCNDPRLDYVLLPPDSSPESLGTHVRLALNQSTAIPWEEFQVIFNSGDVQKAVSRWEDELSKKFGYKTRKALFKNMKNCLVKESDEGIEFTPTRQDRLDGWQGLGAEEKIHISSESSNEAVGAALLKTLGRCE
ncbi:MULTISPECIES: contact-dependent growth inhibition system immunity protein [unclassified Variovorax]|jgi:hypothetical protein|uniref:contact-dependent growth inhibition system immunity protein n=1 Tax=unclassified Variovorax TaxID=663243 RepID=UPI000B8418F1|nr:MULTISPECIES: contact-dependent growth inhibition system immunity protein [unclassified Variovorax]